MQALLFGELERLAAGFSGVVGVWGRSLTTGEEIEFGQSREPYPSASVVKIPILYELLRQAGEGRFGLDDRRELTEADKVPGNGVLQHMSAGTSWPVRDLAALMVIISDNTASNLCIDQVGGPDSVRAAMADLGLTGLQLWNPFYKWQPGRPRNQAVPRDLGLFLDMIVRRQVLTPAACDLILGLMKKVELPITSRYLPDFQQIEAPEPLDTAVAAKSGSIRGCRHEMAAVWKGGRGYVLAVMTKDSQDLREHFDSEGELMVGRIARAVHHHFMGE